MHYQDENSEWRREQMYLAGERYDDMGTYTDENDEPRGSDRETVETVEPDDPDPDDDDDDDDFEYELPSCQVWGDDDYQEPDPVVEDMADDIREPVAEPVPNPLPSAADLDVVASERAIAERTTIKAKAKVKAKAKLRVSKTGVKRPPNRPKAKVSTTKPGRHKPNEYDHAKGCPRGKSSKKRKS